MLASSIAKRRIAKHKRQCGNIISPRRWINGKDFAINQKTNMLDTFIILDQDADYRRVRPKDEPSTVGDVIVATRGQFIISGVDHGEDNETVQLTCIAQPIKD